MPDTKTTVTVTRSFRFDLTADERDERTKSLTDEIQTVYETREAAKESAKTFREDIKKHEKLVSELRDAVANGFEYRDVECEERFYVATGEVVTVRMDTGESVATRRMTPEEKQTRMDF